jgi:hypothetical protein
MLACESHERRLATIHHVVGECAGGEDGGWQRRHFARQSAGGGIDDNIELISSQVGKCFGNDFNVKTH